MPRFREDDDDTYRQAMRDATDPFDEIPSDDDEAEVDDDDDEEDDSLELPF